MVDIEHRALRPLEQDAAAGAARLVEQPPHRRGIGQDFGRDLAQPGEQLGAVEFRRVEPAQQRVMVQQQIVDPVLERRRVGEVANPHRAAPDLVLIGRADAAPGGAELLLAAPLLAGALERAVRGQDQRGVVGELAAFCGEIVSPFLRITSISAMQRPGIDDDAIADDRQFARAHHARRQQAQLVFDIADDERVAGIGAALKAHDDIGALGQPVDDLALALVAPLGADDGDIAHRAPPLAEPLRLAVYKNMGAAETTRLGPPIGGRLEGGDGDPSPLAQNARHGRGRCRAAATAGAAPAYRAKSAGSYRYKA